MKYYDINGNQLTAIYDINGNIISGNADYQEYSSEYQRQILLARDAWITEARGDSDIIPIAIHTDQHNKLTANNALFPYLGLAIPWNDMSAFIGLGDVCEYNETLYANMLTCLDDIPKAKQINIIGNHDTWIYGNTSGRINGAISDEQFAKLTDTWFNNSNYPNYKEYDKFGTQCMIDENHKVKYVTFGGWQYDSNLGGYSHYVIPSAEMDAIIEMLSTNDGYDIVILTHVQPFKTQGAWFIPYNDNGSDKTSVVGGRDVVVNASETSLDQMLYDRKSKTSGTVKDSYGNSHSYDFSKCNSDLLCDLCGHEHFDAYQVFNGGIPVNIFDAYAYNTHPFYFVNIDRNQQRLNVWRADETPQVVNWQVPFSA